MHLSYRFTCLHAKGQRLLAVNCQEPKENMLLQALNGVRTGQQALKAASAAFFLLLAAQLGQGTSPVSWSTAAAASAVIAAIALQKALSALENKFTYENYDHAKS